MKNTKNFMSGKIRTALSAAIIFGLLLSLAFRQTDSAKVFAQSPENEIVASPQQANPTTFSNHTQINIPDSGNASPYPSVITVNSPISRIKKVTVNLRFLQNGRADDLDIYLLAPNGQGTVLMSDAGGTGFNDQTFFTFDQDSTNAIGDDGPLPSGTGQTVRSRPVNYESFNADVFSDPGPGAGTNFPADLNVFNGMNPNGDWKLLVVDDTPGDNGYIAQGWDLVITYDELTVNATDDVVDANGCTLAHCSLREAIREIPTNGKITFSPLFNTPQTINLQPQPTLPPIAALTTDKNLTIEGPGAQLLTIAGANRTNSIVSARVFELTDINAVVTLSGMTITGGKFEDDKGGAIYNQGSLTLSNCIVTDNTADSGGAIYSNFLLDLEGSSIINNRATGTGDGTVAGVYAVSDVKFRNSTISGNRNVKSPPNSAGGLYIENVALVDSLITSTTITNNAADGAGSAGGILSRNGFANLTIYNSIVAGNVNNAVTPDVAGVIYTFGYNLFGNRGAVVFQGPGTQDQSGVSGSPLDPHLAPLNFYGGTTPTHALLGNSTALDKGSTSLATEPIPADQRGFSRPVDIAAIPNADNGADIGAFEARNTLIVNKTADTNDGNCSPTDCSLREAIAAATPGSVIYFSSLFNTPQTITLSLGELVINKNLTILGTGANLITISANSQSRVFTTSSTGVFTVNLQGLMIANGFTFSGAGGAISNNGNLTVSQSHIKNSIATQGGGILNGNNGTLTVSQSTISGNTALNSDSGGGIDSRGALNVFSSTVSGNSATTGGNNAGGIRFAGTTANTAARIENSTITNNTATGTGSAGGLRRTSGAISLLSSSIVAGNVNNSAVPDVAESGSANITEQYNLIGNPGTIDFPNSDVGTAANPLNPMLSPLADNGGTTPTHAIASGLSRALDRGFSGSAISDQRGFLRTFDLPTFPSRFPDSADIGAFEAQDVAPAISISDVSQIEGNSGTTSFIFNVTLSNPVNQTVTVSYQTANGTATAPSDYIAISATTLTFNPNETSKIVIVPVKGDTTSESDETFFVNLSNATGGATIADNQGTGTIRDDDSSPVLVTNANDTGVGSLRQTIADAPPNSNIMFDPAFFNVARTITLNSGELVINKNLNIIGTGANLLTVSGNSSRVFNITSGEVSLSGMTINGGFLNGSGGGILNNGILTVAYSVISDNSTRSGAGISNTNILTVTNSTISNNQVLFGNQTGGGIENTGSRLTINNSTISGNNIPDGNNSGNNHGGGIWTGNNSTVIIINSTITNNAATGAGSAGGIYRENGTVTIRNSIIAGNVSNTTKPDVVASGGTGITSNGYNLLGNRGSLTFSGAGDQSGTGASPRNPQLGALANNGGTTATHALMINSPALDKGQSSGSNTDQRGFVRPVDFSAISNVGDGADIGAFEVQTAPTAASVTIGGRVLTPDGRGLRNASVTLTDQNGNARTVLTTTFGYYRFAEVPVGETYIISINSKRYQFAPQVVSVTEELNELNFTAQK